MHLAMAIQLFLPRFLLAALVNLLLFSPIIIVDGHGYLKTPRSRNYVAYLDGVWSGGTALTPEVEYNYMSADRKAATATCGVIDGIRNYDYPKNAIGGALAPQSQACYQPGQIIELEVTLTAHHKGHFEFKMCPIVPFEAPTQACFDANPLTFVTDTKYGATFDPNYPERAYIPDAAAGNTFSYKYKLPDGLSGDLVLLQWHYVTANSCIPEGYYDYNWPVGTYWSGPNPLNMATCGPLPLDGEWTGKTGAPEQFWNCAEIKVANDCAGVPSLPPATLKPSSITTSLKPTLMPTSSMPSEVTQIISSPTMKPVAQVTSSIPTMKPTSLKLTSIPTFTPAVTNPLCSFETTQCGPTKTCESIGYPNHCCSQYGWCGLVDVSAPDGGAYCGACCQNGPCSIAGVAPSPSVTSKPTSSMSTGDNPLGYCNWGPAGTAASSTCNLEVQGGNWCNTNKDQCEAGCRGKWCTNMMPAPTTMNPTTKAPVIAITKNPTLKPTSKPLAPTKKPTGIVT